MCSGSSGPILKDPLSKTLFTGDSGLAKFSSKVDPLGAYLATGNKGKLDPLNLNNATVIPAPPPPPQEGKLPDTMATRRRTRNAPLQGGTLLTAPSGVAGNSLNMGGATLLGG